MMFLQFYNIKSGIAESQMTKIRSVENAKMMLVKPTARMIVRFKVNKSVFFVQFQHRVD